MCYSGHTWAVDGLDPVLLCAVVGEGFEVHGLEVALGALVFDFPVDGVDVVVDRTTELRLEVTKAEIRDTRRDDSLANKYLSLCFSVFEVTNQEVQEATPVFRC